MRWMNRSWKNFLLAAVTAMSLFPAPALAQDASGKFVLPREVQWGGVSLPPGEYGTVNLAHRSSRERRNG